MEQTERNLKALVRKTSRIYFLPGEEETDRPYLYYIRGDQYSVAVDAGNSKRYVELFYQALREESLPLPRYTVITHWHWDHTFGLPFIHGSSIASQLAREKLAQVSRWEWTREAMEIREKTGEEIAFCNECIQKEYADLSEIQVKTADTGISSPQVLDAGGIHIHLIPRDSVHSRDALFVYVPEEKALFAGDGDCEDHHDPQCAVDPGRVSSLLDFVESLDFEYYFLGHSEPDTREGALEYLRDLRKVQN